MHLPLRLRLTLAFALSMAILLSGVGSLLYVRLAQDLRHTTDHALSAHADLIAAGLDQTGSNFADQGSSSADIGTFAQLLDARGRILESSQVVAGAQLVVPAVLSRIIDPTFGQTVVAGTAVRLLIRPIQGAGAIRFLIVGSSLEGQHGILTRFLLMLALGGPAALALASAIGWWVAGAALRPVERVRRLAAAISESDLDQRLPVPETGDELARLIVTLNSMLERLQSAFERQGRFVDDASHELRTPLTLLKTELDLALARTRTPQQLEAALISASEEADRLAALAEDLLVYSRSDGGRVLVHRTAVLIHEVLRSACDAMAQRARSSQVEIELACPDDLNVFVDANRIRQVADNLLANAVRHTPSGGSVSVSVEAFEGGLRLRVADSGPGFRVDFIGQAFQPFARDASERARAAGGAGLGLAIVRAIAEAHGGTATARNRTEGGAEVTVILPGNTHEPPEPSAAQPESHAGLTLL